MEPKTPPTSSPQRQTQCSHSKSGREDSGEKVLRKGKIAKFQSLATSHHFLSNCNLNVLKFSWYQLLFSLVIHFPSCTKLHVRIWICHPRGKKWNEKDKRACTRNRRKEDCPSPLLRPSPGINTDHTVLTVMAQNHSTAKTSGMDIKGKMKWLFQGHADG